jgi:hypothetical protein
MLRPASLLVHFALLKIAGSENYLSYIAPVHDVLSRSIISMVARHF